MIHLRYPIICIVGPTASGKTALAQAIAERISGEVVSADSMQVYRGMDIGTGKIPVEKRTVPYHMLDILDPGEPYSAALFQEDARKAFSIIDDREDISVLAGGTGFYIRAAIDGYMFPKGDQVDNPIRKRYEDIYEESGADALWKLLCERDPASAEYVHKNNVKRVIRALEMHDRGDSYAELSRSLKDIPQTYDAIFIGLSVDKEVLDAKIEKRVDKMVQDGLTEEVAELLNSGFRDGITAPQAIGYKEIVSYIDGDTDLQYAIDSIKRATRRYAKRQRTWFNKDKRIEWLDASNGDAEALLAASMRIIDAQLDKRKAK